MTRFWAVGCGIFRNADTAASVASRLQVGAVGINDASLTGVVNDVEKNGFACRAWVPDGTRRADPILRKRALLFQRESLRRCCSRIRRSRVLRRR